MCDLAYALLFDELRAHVLAERGVAATLAAAGAKRVQMPDLAEQEERLAVLLEGDRPDDLDPQERALRDALGVR